MTLAGPSRTWRVAKRQVCRCTPWRAQAIYLNDRVAACPFVFHPGVICSRQQGGEAGKLGVFEVVTVEVFMAPWLSAREHT